MWTVPLAEGTRNDLPARIVLRLAPDAQLAAWETTLQAGVAEQGYATPKIRAFDIQPRAGHRAWCVMDHADGTPMLRGLSGPRALLAFRRLATWLPDTLARAAADLHRLDPQPVRAALQQAIPERIIGIDGMLDRYLTISRDLADTRLQGLVERLAATMASQQPHVVCHGDLHPFNVLITDNRYVVLDWTQGQIAHPAYDLAYTRLLLINPPLAVPKPLRPILNFAARRLVNRFIKGYVKIGGYRVDSDTLDWFHTLHSCRILIDLATWRASENPDAHRGHPWYALEPTLLPLLG